MDAVGCNAKINTQTGELKTGVRVHRNRKSLSVKNIQPKPKNQQPVRRQTAYARPNVTNGGPTSATRSVGGRGRSVKMAYEATAGRPTFSSERRRPAAGPSASRDRRAGGRGTGEPSGDGRAGKASERRRREQGCVDGKNVTPPHDKGGRWVDGKKALHNPAHRCAAGNRRFCLPYAFGNAGDRCGDVQRVLNARFAGVDTAFVHYLRTFETEKRIRRWRRDRLCGHFDGRGGMTSRRARRRFVCPSLSHHRGGTLVFVRPQRHRAACAPEVRQRRARTTSLPAPERALQ